jgi:hypothetical protein
MKDANIMLIYRDKNTMNCRNNHNSLFLGSLELLEDPHSDLF